MAQRVVLAARKIDMRVLLFGALLLTCMSCTTRMLSPYPQQYPQQQRPMQQAQMQMPRAQGTAEQMIAQFDQYARANAFVPAVQLTHQPPLNEGAGMSFLLPSPGNSCYVVLALADNPGVDLNLNVTDSRMQSVAMNVHPDAHPWVVFCSPYPGRFVERIDMRHGTSPFFYAVYRGPYAQTRMNLTNFFGDNAPANSAVAVGPMDQSLRTRLDTIDQTVSAQHYRRIGEPVGITAHGGVAQTFPLQLAAGYCYKIVPLETAGVSGTALTVANPNVAAHVNGVVASSSPTDHSLEYCQPADGSARLSLNVRAQSGDGPLYLATYLRSNSPQNSAQIATIPATTATSAPSVIATTTQSTENADESFAIVDADIRARGYQQLSGEDRGSLAQGQWRENTLQLEGGKCYAIAAVGENSVHKMNLFIKGPDGQTLDRDVDDNAHPIVRVCPEAATTIRVRVEMTEGAGSYVCQAYRWPRGVRGPFGLQGIAYVRFAEMVELLATQHFEPDTSVSPEKVHLSHAGEMHPHTIHLTSGQCYEFLAVGGEGISDLDLKLVHGSSIMLSDQSHNAYPTLQYCATGNEDLSVEVKANVGTGDYFLQLFKQSAAL